MEKITLLVNSCDAYSDLWDLFFKALQVQWPDCKFPVALLSETKNHSGYPELKIINFNSPCWGEMLKNALKEIETPYVLPFLDDFVLKEKFTGHKVIDRAVKMLDENPDIGVVYLHRHPYALQDRTEFEGFGLIPRKASYKLTTYFGLWRKTYLDKCIWGTENPWEWETLISRYAWRFKEREYALLKDSEEIFEITGGGVLKGGRWNQEAKILADRYGVKIDFLKRGFFDENEIYHVRKHFPQDIFRKKFWLESRQRIRAGLRKIFIKLKILFA